MGGYRVVAIRRAYARPAFYSTDRSLAHTLFDDVQARMPKAKLGEDGAMVDGSPSHFEIERVSGGSHDIWLLKLCCEHGGEPFAVDDALYYVRFKD